MNKQKRTVNILMVEDNEGDILLTQDAFEESGMKHSLHVATDGDMAMDMLYKRNGFENIITPDIILLDLNLPKRDGHEILETIKSDEILHTIPVIIMTSSSAEIDVYRSYHHHANCYVIKPVDAQSFIDVVKKIENFWVDIVFLSSHKQSERS